MDKALSAWGVVLVLALSGTATAKPLSYPLSPEDHNPHKKPIGVFSDCSVSYAMGTFETSFPIVLPPARNGHTPELAFVYRSDGSQTTLGVGWDIPLDHIRRSLRLGIPRYLGPSGAADDDELEFRLGQHSGTLVYVGTENGFLLYRPKIEGAFAKFYYTTVTGVWIAQDKTGKTWYLGDTLPTVARDQNGSLVYAWYVSKIIDPLQNRIQFEYATDHGNLYPTKISYDLKEGSTPQQYPFVEFTYDMSTLVGAPDRSRHVPREQREGSPRR